MPPGSTGLPPFALQKRGRERGRREEGRREGGREGEWREGGREGRRREGGREKGREGGERERGREGQTLPHDGWTKKQPILEYMAVGTLYLLEMVGR